MASPAEPTVHQSESEKSVDQPTTERALLSGTWEGEPSEASSSSALLKPMEIKRLARVPYSTVIRWLTVGHPRAGILPSIDLAEKGKRHSYRIRREDWTTFLVRLQTPLREQQQPKPLPRPQGSRNQKKGMFR